MKLFLVFAPLLLFTAKHSCQHQERPSQNAPACYKGRLEVKGGCMNYTIAITSKIFDTSLVERNWTDETSGKKYHNVFALKSRCTFPGTINQGDEFYFVIDSTTVQDCAVCLMYYPVPAKQISIKVLPGPCEQ